MIKLFISCLLFTGVPGYAATSSPAIIQPAIVQPDLQFFTRQADEDGYDTETHTVYTQDGYCLTLFRVKSRKCAKINSSLNPCLFWHGLFLSSDDFILLGPGKALGYLFADTCRDVWVANSRGNLYSRRHLTYDPDKDPAFWNFNFVDMAFNDTPAVIDHVLSTTGKDKLDYMGHSQGVTQGLLLFAYRSEYNQKIGTFFGMSPTAWLDHSKFTVLKLEGLLSYVLTPAIQAGLHSEFLPRGSLLQPILEASCGTANFTYELCSQAYFALLGNNHYQLAEDTMKKMTRHIPSGTSLDNFNKWGDVRENGFTKENYGVVKNMQVYGQPKPPEYDLSAVTAPLIVLCSYNDYVAAVEDVQKLCNLVSGCKMCIVSDKSFGHLDFIFGKDSPTLVTQPMLKYLDTGVFDCP